MSEEAGASPRDDRSPRVVGVAAAGVIALAFVGFVTGTHPDRYVPAVSPPKAERASAGDVPPARTHAELASRPWAEKPHPIESGSVRSAVRERAGTVAYSGAPPTIPHPVRASGPAECLACHESGLTLGAAAANPIPHAAFASCTQCHVAGSPSVGAIPSEGPAAIGSTFEGFSAPRRGDRAHATAPPTVPHPTLMRERCGSCHGPLGRAALETPHPERKSCTQCHVAPAARPPAPGGGA